MPERVSDIGEFGLIRRISDFLKKNGIGSERVIVGIGDDTASFLPRPGYELLVTCDCMVEGRHYLPRYIRPLDLGRRAMALNIDFAPTILDFAGVPIPTQMQGRSLRPLIEGRIPPDWRQLGQVARRGQY